MWAIPTVASWLLKKNQVKSRSYESRVPETGSDPPIGSGRDSGCDMLCSRRHIGRRFWFPGKVWVVPPIWVVGIFVWGCGWWLVLAHCIGLFSNNFPY